MGMCQAAELQEHDAAEEEVERRHDARGAVALEAPLRQPAAGADGDAEEQRRAADPCQAGERGVRAAGEPEGDAGPASPSTAMKAM